MGQISLPAEIWHSKAQKMTFLMIKSAPAGKGAMRKFTDELVEFIK